jgi:hypothetical protein
MDSKIGSINRKNCKAGSSNHPKISEDGIKKEEERVLWVIIIICIKILSIQLIIINERSIRNH